MLGKDLSGSSMKELQQLENQLNVSLLSVKAKLKKTKLKQTYMNIRFLKVDEQIITNSQTNRNPNTKPDKPKNHTKKRKYRTHPTHIFSPAIT